MKLFIINIKSMDILIIIGIPVRSLASLCMMKICPVHLYSYALTRVSNGKKKTQRVYLFPQDWIPEMLHKKYMIATSARLHHV